MVAFILDCQLFGKFQPGSKCCPASAENLRLGLGKSAGKCNLLKVAFKNDTVQNNSHFCLR